MKEEIIKKLLELGYIRFNSSSMPDSQKEAFKAEQEDYYLNSYILDNTIENKVSKEEFVEDMLNFFESSLRETSNWFCSLNPDNNFVIKFIEKEEINTVEIFSNSSVQEIKISKKIHIQELQCNKIYSLEEFYRLFIIRNMSLNTLFAQIDN